MFLSQPATLRFSQRLDGTVVGALDGSLVALHVLEIVFGFGESRRNSAVVVAAGESADAISPLQHFDLQAEGRGFDTCRAE
jgi:hypothetical protein